MSDSRSSGDHLSSFNNYWDTSPRLPAAFSHWFAVRPTIGICPLLVFTESSQPPIIRLMPQWTPHSNVADVLSLGPRTAGQLMQVGVRTVVELLAAKPRAVVQRLGEGQFRVETIVLWQREAQLVLVVPTLPPHAARILAAIGYSNREKIARSTPTELLGAFENANGQVGSDGWLEKNSPPTISELATWIHCAQSSSADLAA